MMASMMSRRMPAVVKSILLAGLIAGLLFVSAGRVDLPLFWGYVAILLGLLLCAATRIDPELLAERRRPGPGGLDRATVYVELVLVFAHLVLAGGDVGHWHALVIRSQAIVYIALIALALAGSGILWAMAANPFFSTLVRLQRERGHVVIRHGPYRHVRHPGYSFTCLAALASGVALGSWLAAIPAAAMVAVILRRMVIEDRYLRINLDGYEDYAHSVPYRLVPWIW